MNESYNKRSVTMPDWMLDLWRRLSLWCASKGRPLPTPLRPPAPKWTPPEDYTSDDYTCRTVETETYCGYCESVEPQTVTYMRDGREREAYEKYKCHTCGGIDWEDLTDSEFPIPYDAEIDPYRYG